MTRDTFVQLAASAVLAASVGGTAVLAPVLTGSMGRHRLVYTDTAEAGTPPEVALGIAMGAFRGVFVNYLWLRADALKEDGRYYEAMELARAITTLQPRFPQVWVFQAWNMAYNISVTTQTPQERWQWVMNGVRLLREKGIPANPNSMLLHKELGWIFLHKIQGYTDDANMYYKGKLAEEWTFTLGTPPPPDPLQTDRNVAIQRFVDWLKPIVQAPETLDEVISLAPATSALVDRLISETGITPAAEDGRIELIKRYERLRELDKHALRASIRAKQSREYTATWALMQDQAYAQAWPLLIAHCRKRTVVDHFKMEPDRMLRYTEMYGPLDWRHGAAHAMYWSTRGVENNITRVTKENRQDSDFINTDRITIQAAQDLARGGDIYFNVVDFGQGRTNSFMAMPNYAFVQTYKDVLDLVIPRSWADDISRPWSFYAAGYENFLKDQIRVYFRRGQKDVAEELYSKLRNFPWQNMNDPDIIRRYSLPLDEFVANELFEERQQLSFHVAQGEITAALHGAYMIGLRLGNAKLFRQQMDFAATYHKYYVEQQMRANPVDSGAARTESIPRDFRFAAAIVLESVLSSVSLDDAEKIYDAAPEDLRQAAYDLIVERFKDQVNADAKLGGRPFEQVFVEPPDMEGFRKIRQGWIDSVGVQRRPAVEQK